LGDALQPAFACASTKWGRTWGQAVLEPMATPELRSPFTFLLLCFFSFNFRCLLHCFLSFCLFEGSKFRFHAILLFIISTIQTDCFRCAFQ